MLYVTAAAAIAIVAAAAFGLWRARPPGHDDSEPSIDPRETAVVRARFMVVGGLALCAWFTIVMIAMEIPVLVLAPCTP
jgi:hypothetical protein